MSDLNKRRAQNLLDRMYGPQPKETQKVKYPDGSEGVVPVHSRTLTGEQTNRHWKELADQEERERAEAQAKAEREANQAELVAYKADLSQRWHQNGGLQSDFDELWPQLRKKFLLAKMGMDDLAE